MIDKVKIHLEGGIGDCLRTISYLYPVQSFFDNYLKFIISYITYGKKYNDAGHKKIIEDLIRRLNCAAWIEPKNFDDIDAPELTWRKPISPQLNELLSNHKPYPLELKLRSDEQILAGMEFFKKPYIVLQLSSNAPEKLWNPENYKILINGILEKTTYNIVLLDWKGRKIIDIADSRIFSLIGVDLPLSIEIVRKCSLLIAPDSWTKYVAAWDYKPQILLCATQKRVGLSDVELFNYLFSCILDRSDVKLLGIKNQILERKNWWGELELVESVNKINPNEVLNYL